MYSLAEGRPCAPLRLERAHHFRGRETRSRAKATQPRLYAERQTFCAEKGVVFKRGGSATVTRLSTDEREERGEKGGDAQPDTKWQSFMQRHAVSVGPPRAIPTTMHFYQPETYVAGSQHEAPGCAR